MMNGMACVENLMNRMNRDTLGNACASDNLIDAIPDPDGSIAHKGETDRLRRTQPMQVHGDQLRHPHPDP